MPLVGYILTNTSANGIRTPEKGFQHDFKAKKGNKGLLVEIMYQLAVMSIFKIQLKWKTKRSMAKDNLQVTPVDIHL